MSAVALALILFVVLNGQRQRRVPSSPSVAPADGFAPPPPLRVPPVEDSAPTPPATVIVTSSAPVIPPARTNPSPMAYPQTPVIVPVQPTPFAPSLPASATEQSREKKSNGAVVFDLGSMSTPPMDGATQPSTAASINAGRNGASGFEDAPAKATIMASRTNVVPIGTQIPIALETPIDTARPGLVRAIASRDTLGFDGRRILIPRGSRFVGEYQSEVRSGQSRVFVTWRRVIRPDGVTIRLGSPAADQLGGSGVPGKVNSFFLQRFAGAVLQSALTVGVNLASRPRSGSVVVGIPSGPISTVGQGLIPNDYQPKITVKQGAALNVFVARDLDFSALATGQPSAQ